MIIQIIIIKRLYPDTEKYDHCLTPYHFKKKKSDHNLKLEDKIFNN